MMTVAILDEKKHGYHLVKNITGNKKLEFLTACFLLFYSCTIIHTTIQNRHMV